MKLSSLSPLPWLLLAHVAVMAKAAISPSRSRSRHLRQLESSPSDERPILEGHYASVTLGTGPGGCSGTQEALLDIYRSSDGTSPAPTVLLLPGGAYMNLSGDIVEDAGAQYLGAGYTVAVLYYRLPRSSTDRPWLVCSDPHEAAEDVSAAMRALRENASEWRVDPSRIAIAGFSAGGHLAALHGATCAERGSCPRAQVLHFPFLEKGARIFCADVGSAFMADALGYDGCSPTALADAATPPTVLYHAGGDAVVPTAEMTDFVSALDEQGSSYEYYEVPGGGHYLVPFGQVAAVGGGLLDEGGDYATLVDRALALPSPGCVRCDDVPTLWMEDNNKSCDDAAWHIGRKCADDPAWSAEGRCRASCHAAGRGYPGESCCPPRPSPAGCTECADVPTAWMASNGATCETSSVSIGTKCNYDDWWISNNYCQKSCFDAGRGYDGISCC